MIPLQEALEGIAYKNRATIKKYLTATSIETWEDLDKWHLTRFATNVKNALSPSSAHTTFAVFKAFLGRFEDEITLPKDWRNILVQKNELPMKTYLTSEEVEIFGKVEVKSDTERTVRDGFYVSCKTGLRHSDLVKLLPSNFQPREGGGYNLNYVSQKTRIHATIPCSEDIKDKVAWLRHCGKKMSLAYYNEIIRTLAQRAGINEEVSVYKAGLEISGPKYQFIASHSARISFCTILADLRVPILDISRLAGHKDTATTMRYIVNKTVDLSSGALGVLM